MPKCCPVCKHPLRNELHCETCYGRRCPECAEPIYKDENVIYPSNGAMRHIRCAGMAVARPSFMLAPSIPVMA